MADKEYYVVHTKRGYWVGSFIFDEQLRKAKIYTSLHYAEKTAERLKYVNADKYDPEIREVNICLADEKTAADVVEVEKVAEMLRAMFDDDCACNYNGNDEWLPHVCEYGCTECPDAPEENGCWKQFVKHFLAKMDGERKEQT
jgi:hypothetical protein